MAAPTAFGPDALGAALGVLPGGGAALASFGRVCAGKRVCANRDQLGHGAIEGIAAPEAANNAARRCPSYPC